MNKRNKPTEDQFEDFLCAKNDLICNAAHALINALATNKTDIAEDEEIVPWDMANIGPIVDAAEAFLTNNDIHCCYPYYEEDEVMCFESDSCKNPNCPFKQ